MVDPRFEEVKLIVIREAYFKEFVSKANSSWEENVQAGLAPYQWNMNRMKMSKPCVPAMKRSSCEALDWWN